LRRVANQKAVVVYVTQLYSSLLFSDISIEPAVFTELCRRALGVERGITAAGRRSDWYINI
jgi:hypothetical protein